MKVFTKIVEDVFSMEHEIFRKTIYRRNIDLSRVIVSQYQPNGWMNLQRFVKTKVKRKIVGRLRWA